MKLDINQIKQSPVYKANAEVRALFAKYETELETLNGKELLEVHEKIRAELREILNLPPPPTSNSNKAKKAKKPTPQPPSKPKSKELSPEEAKELLLKLETRFKANMNLHAGVNWNEVKVALESNPEALLSLSKMESAGHEPDVYHEDENDFYFGTCSEESPESGRNLNYAQAVEQAETMGITLMTPEHYKGILQSKGKFDNNTWGWLLTEGNVLSTGVALGGDRLRGYVDIFSNSANAHGNHRAWRGTLKVKKV